MPQRLLSLDVFRGLTVALMILVNNPGSWAHIYPPLRHATWHGLTPTDLVFPFFLFIVGTAMSLSFTRRLEQGARRADLVRKILLRSAVIFALGLFLNGFPFKDFPGAASTLRIMGVLQRIALCYLLAGLAVVGLPRPRGLWLTGAGLLAVYELAMRAPWVAGWGAGSFALEDNLVRWLDLRLLGEAHLWTGAGLPFESEGLLSTLPAVVTTLLGFGAGEILRRDAALTVRLGHLARVGLGLGLAGLGLGLVEPLNKQLWTVSYVAVTGGLAFLTLAACSWCLDVRGWTRPWRPAVVFGSNPLVVFVGSGVLTRILLLIKVDGGTLSLQKWLYTRVFVPPFGEMNGSLAYALTFIGLWLGGLWILWARRIFVKI